MNDNLEWIQNWYRSQCDGDWEHEYGITIETVGNPGWYISINLANTELEESDFEKIKHDDNKSWYFCLKRDKKFEGSCDPCSLDIILKTFRNWVEKQ